METEPIDRLRSGKTFKTSYYLCVSSIFEFSLSLDVILKKMLVDSVLCSVLGMFKILNKSSWC